MWLKTNLNIKLHLLSPSTVTSVPVVSGRCTSEWAGPYLMMKTGPGAGLEQSEAESGRGVLYRVGSETSSWSTAWIRPGLHWTLGERTGSGRFRGGFRGFRKKQGAPEAVM